MERLLVDATKLSGVKYDIKNLNDVYEAIHVVQTEMGIAGTTALESEETISGSFASMKAAFQNTLGSLALGENIKSSLEGLAKTISIFMFGNLIPMVGRIIVSLPSALSIFIKTMISELTKNMSSSIQGSFPIFVQNGVDSILSFVNGIMNEAPTIYKKLGEILASMFDKLLTALPTIIKAGGDLIVGLSKGMLNNLPDIIATVITILAKLIGKIIEHWPQIRQAGIDLIIKLAVGLVSAIPDLLLAIPRITGALIKSVMDSRGGFIEAGKDLMLGLAQGIGDSVGEVVKRAREAAERILSEVKGFFGINSPSRAFMEIGENLNLGLAKGIEDNLAPVTNAMNNLESETTKKLTKDIAFNSAMDKSANTRFIADENRNYSKTSGDFIINIANVNNSNNRSVTDFLKEAEFYRKQRLAATGGAY